MSISRLARSPLFSNWRMARIHLVNKTGCKVRDDLTVFSRFVGRQRHERGMTGGMRACDRGCNAAASCVFFFFLFATYHWLSPAPRPGVMISNQKLIKRSTMAPGFTCRDQSHGAHTQQTSSVRDECDENSYTPEKRIQRGAFLFSYLIDGVPERNLSDNPRIHSHGYSIFDTRRENRNEDDSCYVIVFVVVLLACLRPLPQEPGNPIERKKPFRHRSLPSS